LRILVLGAHGTGLLAAARARGLFVIAVDSDPGAPGFPLAQRRALVPLDDEPSLERLAEAGRVDGVIGTGSAAAVAARIAARFRLHHPLSPETAVLATSRLRQRERLREARVPQTRWAVVSGTAEPGFPCVIRPADRKGRRMAEEASGAAEVTVTAFSRNGAFEPLLGTGLASALAERAARALGIEEGLTSTRLRLGIDGPRVVELRTYVSDREAELCRLLHGVDLHGLALDAALGQGRAAEYVRFGTADARVA
jgi:nucleoside-diphosphate-sugar epimerase